METDYKTIAVVAGIVLVLFAGGLFYVISENRNRQVAIGLVHDYLAASPEQQPTFEALIRDRIENRPIAMTSRASFDSFEQLIATGKACQGYAAQVNFSPRDEQINPEEAWRYCMNNPEVLNSKIENSR